MVSLRGEGTNTYIAGSSVHNYRIERLWRDVKSSVVSTYTTIFQVLEDSGVLDVDNDTDLFCLHYVYIPRLTRSLNALQEAWNNHSLSTEGNWSPLQLFTAYSIGNPMFEDIDPDSYGVHEGGEECDENECIDVPHTYSPLTLEQMDTLLATIDPSEDSTSYGADLYMKTLFTVRDLLTE